MKRQPTDFALWKFSPAGEKRQMEWESPWGIGFPGWHIECSAMAEKYLDAYFDIHCGGEDHIPVHHQRDRADRGAARDAARELLDARLLPARERREDGEESAGEFLRLATLIERGYDRSPTATCA